MLFSYVSVVLSVCMCIAELCSEILGEMQLELLFTTHACIETDIGVHALPSKK